MNHSDCSYIDEVINLIEFGCMMAEYSLLLNALESLSGEKSCLKKDKLIECGEITINLETTCDLKTFLYKYCNRKKVN